MGLFDSIGSALFGDGGASDIRRASKKATAFIDQGTQDAQGYLGQASAGFDPYVQSGQQHQSLYDDFMGLNGPEAQAAAAELMRNNPAFQAQLGQDSNAMSRVLNAQGASGGGKAHLAAQRVYGENAMNFADRYRQGGTQGLTAAGQQGNAFTNQGNLAYGSAATKAGQSINTGNALAQAGQVGVNNLLGLAGAGLNAMGSFYGAGAKS